MKQIYKIKNGELSFRLKLNYNNLHSRLKMVLGEKASLFADISPRSMGITWYADDDGRYECFADAPSTLQKSLSMALAREINSVRKLLAQSPDLSRNVDDILEIPDYSFVFYRTDGGGYKFVLAGWGCKYAHQNTTDSNCGFIKRIAKPEPQPAPTPKHEPFVAPSPQPTHSSTSELSVASDPQPTPAPTPEQPAAPSSQPTPTPTPEQSAAPSSQSDQEPTVAPEPQKVEKKQGVTLRVFDQNNAPLPGETVSLRTTDGSRTLMTGDDGTVGLGEMEYGSTFGISFPNIQGNQERTFEVEANVDVYDAYVKKFVKFAPVLFVEDQDGNALFNYDVKIIVDGVDKVYNTGVDGVIQLPVMQEGQKFIAIDTVNYANSQDYVITSADAKKPYHFLVKAAEKKMVGITVMTKAGKPVSDVVVDVKLGDTPCRQTTGMDGRAEFPYNLFHEGDIPVEMHVKGKNAINVGLRFRPDITEYAVQLKDSSVRSGFNFKWLALLPLLLLLVWGGNLLYQSLPWGAPKMKDMEKGVVMVRMVYSYYVETGFSQDGEPLCVYLEYDENRGQFDKLTLDPSKRQWTLASGTGFIISKDGLIATNRHVADPIPPENAEKLAKQLFFNEKEELERLNDSISDILRQYGTLSLMGGNAKVMYDNLSQKQKQIRTYLQTCEKLLVLGDFVVKTECHTSVAFVNSIVNLGTGEGFVACSLRESGKPGTVDKNDIAIMQLNNKNRDLPKDAYIFNVPEKDLMDYDTPEDYDITVIGYNRGEVLADPTNGIHPQPQPGKITQKNLEYRIGYNASTLEGSSGGPVINKKGQLVAINNSKLADTQGFNFGVRTKYLNELLQQVLGNTNNTKTPEQ